MTGGATEQQEPRETLSEGLTFVGVHDSPFPFLREVPTQTVSSTLSRAWGRTNP